VSQLCSVGNGRVGTRSATVLMGVVCAHVKGKISTPITRNEPCKSESKGTGVSSSFWTVTWTFRVEHMRNFKILPGKRMKRWRD
jgi:hypothetical protein